MPEKPPLHVIRRRLSKPRLKELLKDATNEPNNIRKGEKFEYFFENFVNQQQGFTFIKKHCRSEVGEIDYFYRTELYGHPLWERYPYLFIECKNWKEKISSEKMNHYISLLKAKNFFPSCCGIYITTSSFSPQALRTVRDARKVEKLLIILIGKRDLNKLLEIGLRAFLQEQCDKIISKA